MLFPVEGHDMVKLREAQRILNLNRSAMHDLIKSGSLPAKKVGKEWRILGQNLMAWIEKHQCDDEPEYQETPLNAIHSPELSYIGDWT